MTQITHEFECPFHGRFDFLVKFGESPPPSVLCPAEVGALNEDGFSLCRLDSPWRPPHVGVVWKI